MCDEKIMSNSIVCSTFNVKCSWEGLPEGRNCFCLWSFWCSELCSVDQAVAVQRECAGFEGSGVILPALLLTLDKYSSWRVGRVVPMIRSAIRTTLRSLRRSDLVAELNQTDVDVQRTDSMMAEKNCFSSSSGRLHFLSWRRKYSLCWAFFINVVYVIVPLQVQRDCGAQESEWLHCSHSAVHDCECGGGGGFSWCPRSSPLFRAC